MANSKMTQKDMFNEIITLAENAGREDIVKFAQGRIEVLNRKASGKKATKTQKENEDIKTRILQILTENDKPMSVTEMLNTGRFNDFEKTITNQKVSALLRQLILAEKVEKKVEKKVSYFSII